VTLSGLVLHAGDISKLVGLQLGQRLIRLGWQQVEILRYTKLGELWLAWSFNGKTRWWWCEVECWHNTTYRREVDYRRFNKAIRVTLASYH
jgi:hypothetical protein